MAAGFPLPLNTCSIVARDPLLTLPKGRLQLDARLHPQGGLTEICEDDCDDVGQGLGLSICGGRVVEDPPSATITNPDGSTTQLPYISPIKVSSSGCIWVDRSLNLPSRIKECYGAQVASPASVGNGAAIPIGVARTFTITNNSSSSVCYEPRLRISNAFIDCPEGAAGSVTIPNQSLSGEAETLSIGTVETTPPAKASVGMRVTFDSQVAEFLAAGTGDYGVYSGDIIMPEDIIVAPGATFTSTLIFELVGHGNATSGPTASSGDVCVVLREVACEEVC